MERLSRLPEAELTVMRAVWALPAPAATGAVRAQLERERPWNLSALQTLLSRLAEKGYLASEMAGRQRVWTPLVAEREYLAFENRPFLGKRPGAALSSLVASLYEENAIGRDDLEELRAFLDRAIAGEEAPS